MLVTFTITIGQTLKIYYYLGILLNFSIISKCLSTLYEFFKLSTSKNIQKNPDYLQVLSCVQ